MEQKAKKREVTDYVYVAVDGTEFNDRDECKKYENSALCAIEIRYKKLVVNTIYEDGICALGCEDNKVEIVDLKTDEDVKTVIQRYAIMHGNDSVERWCKNVRIGRCFIGRGYDYENFWIIGMVEDIIENIKSL